MIGYLAHKFRVKWDVEQEIPAAEKCSPRLRSRPGPLADPENDKLGGLHHCHADFGNHLPQLTHLQRICLVVTLDEKRLLGRIAEQRTVAPHGGKKGAHIATDLGSQAGVVRLKNHPLGPLVNRLAKKQEQSPHVNVLPIIVGVAAQRAEY